jgi:predicted metal-dependent peptidase
MAGDRPADPFALIEREAFRQNRAEQAARALTAARARLVLGRDAKSAFFATLALRLVPQVDETCGTMATDGRTLAYCPEFVAGLAPDELLGVLVHEVMHNALAHPCRRGHRDPETWNLACDLAVNPHLLDAGFTLPDGRVVPGEGSHAHLPQGKSAEEYYALLGAPNPGADGPTQPTDSSPPTKETDSSTDPGGCGGVRDPDPNTAGDNEAEWQAAVAQAEQAAKGRGELPSGLRRVVDGVLRPAADWRSLLREFLGSHARNDFSWTRPNRRFVARGLYLPGLHSEELGPVAIALDTSGSIGAAELNTFAAEVNAILDAFDCTVTVLHHDTEIQNVQTWSPTDGPLVLDPVGGGGTSHECVFDWLANADPAPSCVICLTDLETRFPDHLPDLPVLWAVIGESDTQPPFGRRIAVGP